LDVVESEEPHADALLAWVVPGTNESTNEARRGRGKARCKRGYRLSRELDGHDRLLINLPCTPS
jgi:hypothetical protein